MRSLPLLLFAGFTLALLAVATLVSFVGQFAFWRRDIG